MALAGDTGEPGVASYIGFPLRINGEVAGTLELENLHAPDRLNDYLGPLRLVASVASLALGNAALFSREAAGKRDWEKTFDATSDGIAILSPDFHILRLNHAFAALFNSTPGSLTGCLCYEAIHSAGLPPPGCPVARCLVEKGRAEVVWQERRTGDRWLQLRADPDLGESGEVLKVVYTIRDVTVAKEVEQQKDEFMSLIAHELRTPLTVIIGGLRTALSESSRLSPDESRQLLEDAVGEAESMSELVGNLLELSRAEAKRLMLQSEDLAIIEVLDTASRRMAGLRPTHRFLVEAPPEGLPPAQADRMRLERVIYNLLDNAAKYSPAGSDVHTFVRREGDCLIVSVTDCGQGIALEDQARLFRRFERLGREDEGIGIGLLVCRRLVEAHGGRMWVESQPGKGATFCFTLPISGAPGRPPA